MREGKGRVAQGATCLSRRKAIRYARPVTESVAPSPVGDALERACAAARGALDKKALEPVLLDVRNVTSYTDYILIVSGRSDRQVQAIADGVLEAERNIGVRPLGIEGDTGGQWILIDFGDVVVHVFYHPVREFYDIEGLWNDVPRVKLEVPEEARIPVEASY